MPRRTAQRALWPPDHHRATVSGRSNAPSHHKTIIAATNKALVTNNRIAFGRAQRRTLARLTILNTSPAAVIVVAMVAMTTDISI